MPSPQAHNLGCIVPSGSNGNSMPVEHNSKREKKIVSSGTVSVILPGGGVKASFTDNHPNPLEDIKKTYWAFTLKNKKCNHR